MYTVRLEKKILATHDKAQKSLCCSVVWVWPLLITFEAWFHMLSEVLF